MNQTERMSALVEELRASAPRARSSTWLAGRFEVSTRTVERDIAALQRAGVPIRATAGRRGGYSLDATMALPPLTFTASEAAALVAIAAADPQRGQAAHTGLRKIAAALSPAASPAGRVPDTVVGALADNRLLEIDYVDRNGVTTSRSVEPTGLVTADRRWYLVAWCRLRGDYRAFRIDRIQQARAARRGVSGPQTGCGR